MARNLLRLGGNSNDPPIPGRIENLDLTEPTEPQLRWHVKKVLLCRDKGSVGTDLVKYVKETVLHGVAEPNKEWFVQVTVYCANVVSFIGEVVMPADGSNPTEEIRRLHELARARADFLNINNVELPGPPIIEDP